MANAGYSQAAAAIDLQADKCERSAQLRELSDALRKLAGDPANLESARHWANVDLFAAFLDENPGRAETGWAARVWAGADTAVQVLVFVPILLTWIGLAWAAFADRGGQSLLQVWQSGGAFGVSFHLVALYTACIVFLLIGVSIALIIHRRQLQKEEADLRGKLADALTRASLELAPVRLGITERVAQKIGDMTEKLVETADAIEAAGQAAARAQQHATAAVTAAVPTLSSVEAAATASRHAATELGKAPSMLSPHLLELTETAKDAAKAQRELVIATEALSKRVADTLGASARGLADASAAASKRMADTFGVSSRKLADASAASSKQIADTLAGGANEVRHSLGEVTSATAWSASRAEVAADILGQAQQSIVHLPRAVAELQVGVGDVGTQILHLTEAVKATENAAANLLVAVTAFQHEPVSPERQTESDPAEWPTSQKLDDQVGPPAVVPAVPQQLTPMHSEKEQ